MANEANPQQPQPPQVQKVLTPMPRRFLVFRVPGQEDEIIVNLDNVAKISPADGGSSVTLFGVPEGESVLAVRETVKEVRAAMTREGIKLTQTFTKCP